MKREILVYLLTINILAIFLTTYDKIASKKFRRKRIRENVLLLVGILGASLSMYLTMHLIHHKTKHKKFMLGLPLIIIIHVIALFLIFKNYLSTKCI